VNAPLIGTYTGNTLPPTLSSTGGQMLLEFRSDCASTQSGWEANYSSNNATGSLDITAPTTSIGAFTNWHTTNFPSAFTDEDGINGSGIKHQFWQVIDYNGSEWRANTNHGFFNDNFDSIIHQDWINQVGNWSINNNVLRQNDTLETNSNLYTYLNQNTADKYLYHWVGAISGNAANKRAGLHFMCSDGSLPNRGNSYFVWFRSDQDKVQIYKVVNDVFSLETDQSLPINDNQWYDIKVTYSKTTGSIDVWVDQQLVSSWVDPSPHTTGNAISFRTAECIYDIDNLNVYTNRSALEIVTVGNNQMIRHQNTNPLSAAGNVRSIVIDTANNLSGIATQNVNIDWSIPNPMLHIKDGLLITDIDTVYNNTELSATWTTTLDTHSNIARYWYAIGSTPGGTDIVNWTDNWFSDSVTHSGLNLTYGVSYFYAVRAENGAGLLSNSVISDGQYLSQPILAPNANFTILNTHICAGDSIQLTNSSSNAVSYSWSIPGTIISNTTAVNPYVTFPTSGLYTITLNAVGPGGVDSVSQNINVTINQTSNAIFSVSDTIVSLPNAFIGFNNMSTNANGYLWQFGDGNSSTDINPWHIYSTPGLYVSKLIAINGSCPNDTANINITVTGTVGTNNQKSERLLAFPNPTDNQLYVNFYSQSSNIIKVKLIDIHGKHLKPLISESNTSKGYQLILNLSDLSSGIYLLLLYTQDDVFQKRIEKI